MQERWRARVAIATDDGRAVCQDLASAKFLLLVTVKSTVGGERELRLKPRKLASPWEPAKRDEKALMAEIAARAEGAHLLVAGGMSRIEWEALGAAGKKCVLTDLVLIEDVIGDLAKGTLVDHPERIRPA